MAKFEWTKDEDFILFSFFKFSLKKFSLVSPTFFSLPPFLSYFPIIFIFLHISVFYILINWEKKSKFYFGKCFLGLVLSSGTDTWRAFWDKFCFGMLWIWTGMNSNGKKVAKRLRKETYVTPWTFLFRRKYLLWATIRPNKIKTIKTQ